MLIAAAALVAARAALPLARLAASSEALPRWDMASHGLDGLRLAQAAAALDLGELVAHLFDMSVWPPVFPLVEAPAFLVFGPSYQVPRLLMAGLFLLTAAAAYRAGRRSAGELGPAVGLMLVGAFAVSPFYHLYGTLIMLEVPGTLLLFAAIAAYGRALAEDTYAAWRRAVLLAALLFFCKFNYGLLWIAPVVLAEARRSASSWRRLAAAVGARLRRIDPRRPWTLFVLASLGFLVFVRSSGGFELEVWGVSLRATSLGGPAYALFVICLGRWLWRQRCSALDWRQRLARLDERSRAAVLWLVLPVVLWMLAPSHAKDFFKFVENRSSGLGFLSAESLLFYPRAFVESFAPTSAIGWVTLALAVVCALRLPRLDDRERPAVLALALGFVALVVHPYKLPRFFSPLAPLVWLAAALSVAHGCRWLGRRAHLAAPAVRRLALGAAAGALLYAGHRGVDEGWLRSAFAGHTVPAASAPMLDVVAEVAAAGPAVLLGTWDGFSPALVEWHLRQRTGRRAADGLVCARRWQRDRSALELERRLLGLAPGTPVLSLEALSEPAASAGFRLETAWLDPVRASLASGAGFVLARRWSFPPAGYRLSLYRRSPSEPVGDPSKPLVSSSLKAAS